MNLFSAFAAITFGTWIAVPGGSWQPSPQQIQEIRSNLEPFVKQQATRGQSLHNWSDYVFQYQGQLDNDQKIIFINALCNGFFREDSKMKEKALRELIRVNDGGTCFFNVKYDPVKKVFFQFWLNGEA